MSNFTNRGFTYTINRYPPTIDRSLRAWSAADELLLSYAHENQLKNIALINDRFGFLSLTLRTLQPSCFYHLHNQYYSIIKNHEANGLAPSQLNPINKEVNLLFSSLIISAPKSIELFQFFLHSFVPKMEENGVVVIGFMTRHFTKKWLSVASLYFYSVSQSRASKKARLLILKGKKDALPEWASFFSFIYKGRTFSHYPGVFSAGGVDLGTRFLLENLPDLSTFQNILDLGSGCGIIADTLVHSFPQSSVATVDNNLLATLSCKLNLPSIKNHFFHHNPASINFMPDLIITNPPFHHEWEQDLGLPYGLFQRAHDVLPSQGVIIIVANKHLGYSSFLSTFYSSVRVSHSNEKYQIIVATK